LIYFIFIVTFQRNTTIVNIGISILLDLVFDTIWKKMQKSPCNQRRDAK